MLTDKIKLLVIVGARPQFVKAAALSRALKKHPIFTEIIVHTGQHFDVNMSDIFFEEMEIPKPTYNLNIHGLSHGAMTGQMLEELEKIMLLENPNMVVVFGDTNSTLAGALAAKKLHIPIAHIEAGLRSFNMQMPEEVNRILTDRLSTILFCPTDNSMLNLRKEGYENFNIKMVQSGDIMEDATLYYKNKANSTSHILESLKIENAPFILATIHRAENTDDLVRLKEIVTAFNTIAKSTKVIVPLHPRTTKVIRQNNILTKFTIIEPIGYFDMLQLLSNCDLVMTDSGGLQKEAYFFNKYCITFRDETEWIELVNFGYNKIVGANSEKIINSVNELIHKPFVKSAELYGGGEAADIICLNLLECYQLNTKNA
jgi:UDP-GlcNAc3NAcA epimerase